MESSASPFIITQPEFMRRMKEMQQTGGGGMFGMGALERVPFFNGIRARDSSECAKYTNT